jgi:adenylate kinase family enzyme
VLLGPDDPLPARPQRILVNGSVGAGKSTLARAIADRLSLPYTELDSLYHGPQWTPRPEFHDDVARVVAGDRWVSEYQYRHVRPTLLARADLMIWLDLPRRVSMFRAVRRTLRRRRRREVLWNGNVERPLWHILVDPEHIIRWAWTSHPGTAQRVDLARQERPELPVVRLRSAAEVDRWLGRLSAPGGRPARPR